MHRMSNSNKVYVLMHGLGNSTQEFKNIKTALENKETIINVTLPFHENEEDFDSFKVQSFINRFGDIVKSIENKYKDKNIIYVSSSISCLALLETSKTIKIKRAVFISPYLGCSSAKERYISLASKVFKRIKRKSQIAKYIDVKDLLVSKYFSLKTLKKINQLANKIRFHSFENKMDILVIHSSNDQVACFEKSASFFKRYGSIGDFIAIYSAPHTCAPLFESESFKELIDEHFFPSNEQEPQSEEICTQYSELNIEHRDWAAKIFRIFIGFLSLFGVMLYKSLPDIISKKEHAIYILLAYGSTISIYLIISGLYYFYLIRSQYVLNIYVEPLFKNVGYQQIKLSENASGKVSKIFTKVSSFVMMAIPTVIAFFTYFYGLIIFWPDVSNYLVVCWYIVNTILYCMTFYVLTSLGKYTKHSLTNTPTPLNRSYNKNRIILNFISKIRER